MEKQYYRHVAGARPVDVALCGPSESEASLIRYISRVIRGNERRRIPCMKEMVRVARVKRKWRNA